MGDLPQAQNAPEDDIFAEAVQSNNGPVSQPAVGGETDEEAVTFLSVWEEQRRKTLSERAAKEEVTKKQLTVEAKKELDDFMAKRAQTIKAAKEQNLVTERDLKDEIAAVFKSGTIWEQVAKMVSLQGSTEKKGGPDRMRSLLIHLKNQK